MDDALEQERAERACRSTVKRLRDEVREVSRRRATETAVEGPAPAPLNDDAWYASVARPASRSTQRVRRPRLPTRPSPCAPAS